jgi:hypothetical protein
MYKRNVVARSRYRHCGGNAIMRSVRVGELQDTVNILSLAQQWFYGNVPS